jgi:hypothetical protein
MYCPKCATDNIDGTKFCRGCGSNLSLVPQALTGRLPEARSGRRRHRDRDEIERGGPAVLANGITKAFMGLGFMCVSLGVFAFAPAGRLWWFWMLIPAFAMLGKGVAEILSFKYGPNQVQGTSKPDLSSAAPTGQVPPPRDAFVSQPGPQSGPPSVTEQTTRHLDRTTDPYQYRDRDAH